MQPNKCKVCGVAHWGVEHVFAVTPSVTVGPRIAASVTKNVTVPTEAEMIAAAVHPEHECPICGFVHKRPKSSAERQKAYRQRQRA